MFYLLILGACGGLGWVAEKLYKSAYKRLGKRKLKKAEIIKGGSGNEKIND
jgi:hypothetical protein